MSTPGRRERKDLKDLKDEDLVLVLEVLGVLDVLAVLDSPEPLSLLCRPRKEIGLEAERINSTKETPR